MIGRTRRSAACASPRRALRFDAGCLGRPQLRWRLPLVWCFLGKGGLDVLGVEPACRGWAGSPSPSPSPLPLALSLPLPLPLALSLPAACGAGPQFGSGRPCEPKKEHANLQPGSSRCAERSSPEDLGVPFRPGSGLVVACATLLARQVGLCPEAAGQPVCSVSGVLGLQGWKPLTGTFPSQVQPEVCCGCSVRAGAHRQVVHRAVTECLMARSEGSEAP